MGTPGRRIVLSRSLGENWLLIGQLGRLQGSDWLISSGGSSIETTHH